MYFSTEHAVATCGKMVPNCSTRFFFLIKNANHEMENFKNQIKNFNNANF